MTVISQISRKQKQTIRVQQVTKSDTCSFNEENINTFKDLIILVNNLIFIHINKLRNYVKLY